MITKYNNFQYLLALIILLHIDKHVIAYMILKYYARHGIKNNNTMCCVYDEINKKQYGLDTVTDL